MSNKVVKFSIPYPPYNNRLVINRNSFFAPFESYFDDVFNKLMSPEFTKVFGDTPFKDSAYPKVNVIDYDDRVEIEAELAGYAKSDISIEVVENTHDPSTGILCISGDKSTKTEDGDIDDRRYLYRELKRSKFSRSFNLGEQLNSKGISAKFEEGLLRVSIPRVKKVEPEVRQKVEIK